MSDDKIVVEIDSYGSSTPVPAATFGVGASTLAEINQATEARRELISQQSDTRDGPVRRS
jgi:hypothetical protein